MTQSGTIGSNVNAKRAKFRALAEARTIRALEDIRRIGNLSNPHLYEWDEIEVRKIIKALKEAIGDIEARFASPKGKASAKFQL
jgi:hypothetical protein